jgi:hypothetical protein
MVSPTAQWADDFAEGISKLNVCVYAPAESRDKPVSSTVAKVYGITLRGMEKEVGEGDRLAVGGGDKKSSG